MCGAIFRAAGHDKLQSACDAIGHCDTGSAVITPGFDLKAKYVIHAVGPVWSGGDNKESQLLYSAYRRSLELAVEVDGKTYKKMKKKWENRLYSIEKMMLYDDLFGDE